MSGANASPLGRSHQQMSAQVDVKPGLDFETRLFIGGEFVDAVEGGRIPVTNPHDNSLIAEVAEARAADIDRAVSRNSGRLPRAADSMPK